VTKLLLDGIIEESVSPWNSLILVIHNKVDASGQPKLRLVIDYRMLKEKTLGNAYALLDITEIVDQLGQT
jgi:hypothetical protein